MKMLEMKYRTWTSILEVWLCLSFTHNALVSLSVRPLFLFSGRFVWQKTCLYY